MGRRNSRRVGKSPRVHRRSPAATKGQCPYDGKTSFRTYEDAAGHAFARDPDGAVYLCRQAGAYHVSRETPAEYDQRLAQLITPKEQRMPVHAYQAADLPPDHRGNRPCVCGRAKTNAQHDPEELALRQAEHAAEQAQHRARVADND